MKREEILDQFEATRERLLEALEPLPDEALVAPGVMGEWSIADILAHLTAWESELITALMRIDQGKKPAKLLEAYKDVDGYNARRYEESKGRDLDRIFTDLHAVRVQTEQWLEEFSNRELSDPDCYPWAKGKPLWMLVKDNSFGHEVEHLDEIEAFASRWQPGS